METELKEEQSQIEKVELLPDPTPILTLPPDEVEEELTEEEKELKLKKEKVQRCKAIVLYRMGHHPILTNISNFKKRAKEEVIEKVKELFEKPNEEIIKEFNDIICDYLYENGEDYSKYPIYQMPRKKRESIEFEDKPTIENLEK